MNPTFETRGGMLRFVSKLLSIGWLAVAASSCHAGSLAPATGNATRVLFVGNSLTYYNDLPSTIEAIAASGGDTFDVGVAVAPNVAIIDHLKGATDALQQLRDRKWDYVVLQQGPTTAEVSRDSLILWTKMFDPHIRGAGATPALFMAWPSDARWDRMDLVRQSFQQAAEAVNGIFLPAGEAWRLAHEADPNIALYRSDNFHPSELGSFLAALTIYERLSGRDARTLPAKAFSAGKEISISVEVIRKLQKAAHDAHVRYPRTP